MPRVTFEQVQWGDLSSKNYGSGSGIGSFAEDVIQHEIEYETDGKFGGPESFTDSTPNTYNAAMLDVSVSSLRNEIVRAAKIEPRVIAGAVIIYDGALIFGNCYSVGWR
jgi:hypothetical protein